MPDFKVAIVEKIKEVLKFVKEAVSLTPKISMSDRFITNVVKPATNIIAGVVTAVSVFWYSFFLRIPSIIDSFIINPVKPTPTILATTTPNMFGASLDAPKPDVLDSFLTGITIPFIPTFVGGITLGLYYTSEMAPKPDMVDSFIENPVKPTPTILATVITSVVTRKEP